MCIQKSFDKCSQSARMGLSSRSRFNKVLAAPHVDRQRRSPPEHDPFVRWEKASYNAIRAVVGDVCLFAYIVHKHAG